MLHESKKTNTLTVRESGITFDEVHAKPYISDDIKADVMNANALLLPNENFREGFDLLFPEYTTDFFAYLKSNQSDGLNVDIAISDDEFKPIEMHSEMLNLPILLVEWVFFPLLVNVISNYLYDYITKRKNAKNEHKVIVKIIVEETKTKKTKTIEYEGDADKFSDAMKSLDETLFK